MTEIKIDNDFWDDNSSTPYDDVFRTLLNDCKQLIIAVINEAFHEHYTGKEKIEFYPNEHFINQQDGKEQKRVTDTFFIIYGDAPHGYHIECQSTSDGSIVIRIFEYDSQIALDEGKLEGNTFHVKFPESAIIFLRSNASTPDMMKIIIEVPNGSISYDVPVIKVQEYSLDEIFDKGLLFLIPFYIFTHESRFEEYERDEEKMNALWNEFELIRRRLDELTVSGNLQEYMEYRIFDMTKKVIAHITKNYKNLREGARTVVGGRILDYPAKTMYIRGQLETLFKLVTKGLLSIKDAAESAEMTEDEFQSKMRAN